MSGQGRCGTCRFWAKGAQASLFPNADPERGNCERVGEAWDDPTGTDLAHAAETSGLGSAWLETLADFGCVLHEAAT